MGYTCYDIPCYWIYIYIFNVYIYIMYIYIFNVYIYNVYIYISFDICVLVIVASLYQSSKFTGRKYFFNLQKIEVDP